MNHIIEKEFEARFHRPVDIFRKRCYENIDIDIARLKINNYFNEMKRGMKSMQTKSIVIAGLIHNAEQQIRPMKMWFDEMKKLCKSCHIVIVENNSIDNTEVYCKQWQRMDPKHVHLVCDQTICNNNWKIKEDKGPESERIEKMSYLRNLYLDYIQANFSTGIDYVFAMDFDLRGILFWDGLFHSMYCFDKNAKIEALACNGLIEGDLLYYDSFAFARDRSELRWSSLLDKANHDQEVLLYISKEYEESQELDHVASAFGGFCIYRFEHFIKHRYGYEKDRYTCEHCVFHENFEHFYVNPNMVFLIQENIT